ncbi:MULTISPECIES: hypothetical protein [unclassified Agarivorans]|uniref:hypothetical protein n=1 Tax=unclassified Agarivorans TaxID=2636026 RepID=UPI003D7CA978
MKLKKLHYLLTTTLLLSSASFASSYNIADDAKLDFAMDAYVRSHVIKPDNDSSEHGFTSRMRIKANLLLNDGWSIHSRWQAYYNWAGDRRHSGSPATNFTDGENNDGLSLDLGFAQYAKDGLLLRAGRQRADWAYGFNINNDRRDRLLAMKSYNFDHGKQINLIGIYDLRFSESEYDTTAKLDDYYADVSMYALAAMGKIERWDWGMLWAYFDGSENNIGNSAIGAGSVGYGIDYFHNISPFFTGHFNDFTVKGAMNIILSDSTEKNGYYTTWGNNGYAGFLETSYQISPAFKLQAQALGFVDGGLIGRGFDTYSGLINNSNRNDASPIYRQFFGGLGHEDNDGQIIASRLNWQVSKAWQLQFAAGHMNIDNYLGTSEDLKASFLDAKSHYQWSKYTDLGCQISWANEDIDDLAAMFIINIKYD